MASSRLKLVGRYLAWGPHVREGRLTRADETVEKDLVRVYPQSAPSPARLTRLREDAAMLSRIRHDNILRVEHVTAVSGRAALVLEGVEGVSLRRAQQILKLRSQVIPTRAAIEVVCTVAAAVDAALSANIADESDSGDTRRLHHPGTSPDEVLVDALGRIKVTGFTVIGGDLDSTVVAPMGYTPPEGPTSTRGPVYGLGALLLELLTLEAPPPAQDLAEDGQPFESLLEAARNRPGESANDEIIASIRHAMRIDPNLRPSAADLARRLREISIRLQSPGMRTWAPAAVPDILRWQEDRKPVVESDDSPPADSPPESPPTMDCVEETTAPVPEFTAPPPPPNLVPSLFASTPQRTDPLAFINRSQDSPEFEDKPTILGRLPTNLYGGAEDNRPTMVTGNPFLMGRAPDEALDGNEKTEVIRPDIAMMDALRQVRGRQASEKPSDDTLKPRGILPPPPPSPPPPPARPEPPDEDEGDSAFKQRSWSPFALILAGVAVVLVAVVGIWGFSQYLRGPASPPETLEDVLAPPSPAVSVEAPEAVSPLEGDQGLPPPEPGTDLSGEVAIPVEEPASVPLPPTSPPSRADEPAAPPTVVPTPPKQPVSERAPEAIPSPVAPAPPPTEPSPSQAAPTPPVASGDVFRVEFRSVDANVVEIEVKCYIGEGRGPSPVIIANGGKGPCRVTGHTRDGQRIVTPVVLTGPRSFSCFPSGERVCN